MGVFRPNCKVSQTKMTTITNPTVPFEFTIPGGCVSVGQCLMVHGRTTHDAQRFSIQLIKAHTEEQVFHFNVRFDQGHTVRNTAFPSWGDEEISPCPLYHGNQFCIEIRCLHDRFEVMVDGHHHCDYRHRVNWEEATALKIEGDCSVEMVQFN